MERDATFDIMKGIGILAVIAGHTATHPTFVNDLVVKLIYSFHMPLFFMIAGYFYKEGHEQFQKIKGDFNRLIIPYLATCFAFLLYQCFTSENFLHTYKYALIAIIWGSGTIHTSPFWGNMSRIGAIWFLPALFWSRTVFNFIFTRFKHPYVTTITIALLATIIDRYFINLPFALLPGLSAMTFYLIGYCLKYYKPSLGIVLLCSICWILHIAFSKIDMCVCFYKYYPLDILGATFAVIFIYFFSRKISSLTLSKYISRLGKVSLTILCFHTLELFFVDYSIPVIHDNWFIFFLVRSVVCISLALTWLTIISYCRQISSNHKKSF